MSWWLSAQCGGRRSGRGNTLQDVDYSEYLDALNAHASLAELSEYGAVREDGVSFPLVRLTLEGEPWVTITSGFHGEEPAGPLTFAALLPEVLAFARTRGVGLRIYPCVNPSGFERRTRYNASGERPNNDFLRYEVSPGVWKGELPHGEPYLRWRVHREGPKETRALVSELEAQEAPWAALDLHQDNYMERAATYAYVFGEQSLYLPLVRAASRHVKVAVRCAVDEWHRTDEAGLVRYHDGSVTDYFLRRGATVAAAVETTTRSALGASFEVNLVWIRGFIEYAALSLALRGGRGHPEPAPPAGEG